MAEELSDEKKLELWKAFHTDSLFGPVYTRALEERLHLGLIQTFYDADDIFRRGIDFLRDSMAKKKMKRTEVDKKIGELLKEAEYRCYIATFGNMKKKYEVRKQEMAKIGEAMHF